MSLHANGLLMGTLIRERVIVMYQRVTVETS